MIEFLNDGPTPAERKKKRDFYKYKDDLLSHAKDQKERQAQAADNGQFYLGRRAPLSGVCVKRIWPKPVQEERE